MKFFGGISCMKVKILKNYTEAILQTLIKISSVYFSAVSTGQRIRIWMKPLVIFMCQAVHFLAAKYSFKKVFSVIDKLT